MIAKSWTRATNAPRTALACGHGLLTSLATLANSANRALAAPTNRQAPTRARVSAALGQARCAAPIIGPLAAPPS